MTRHRRILVVSAMVALVGGVVTIAVLLQMPGWAYPPVVVVVLLGVAVLGAGAATGGSRSRDLGWREVLLGLVVVVVASVTIGVALDAAPTDRPYRLSNATVAESTDTIRALYSVPADAASRSRRDVFLAGRLASPLVSDGAGLIPTPVPLPRVPGAASVLDVQRVGVVRAGASDARLLLFGVIRVRVPGRSPPEVSAPIARSVVLRRVDATWRVADIYPVGLGG